MTRYEYGIVIIVSETVRRGLRFFFGYRGKAL